MAAAITEKLFPRRIYVRSCGVREGEPIHFGAYLACVLRLDGKDPLRCNAFTRLVPALAHDELTALLEATKRRWLAYDHVQVVAGRHGKCKAMYVARGRPDATPSTLWTRS